MKKMFLVVMDYEEITEDMFTDVGVEVTFDNQLYELKEAGHVSVYSDTEAYDLNENKFNKIMEIVDEDIN